MSSVFHSEFEMERPGGGELYRRNGTIKQRGRYKGDKVTLGTSRRTIFLRQRVKNPRDRVLEEKIN